MAFQILIGLIFELEYEVSFYVKQLVIEIPFLIGLLIIELILKGIQRKKQDYAMKFRLFNCENDIQPFQRISKLFETNKFIEIELASQLVGMTERGFKSYLRHNKKILRKYKIDGKNIIF